MSAEECVREGNLPGALEALQGDVRADPADPKQRIFLFQLLSVMGQWDRALTQLNVTAQMDSETVMLAMAFRAALQGEGLRRAVWQGKRSPLIFGDPAEWIALMVEALRVEAAGKQGEAGELRARALEEAPTTAGRINGETAFEWIADADSRLGPLMEVILDGKYYWVPFDRVARIAIAEPADLRDFVWTPAMFTWANGGEAGGFIPTRYPGSEEIEDSAIRLARRTEWSEAAPDCWHGSGQRMFTTDQGDHPLLETRELELTVAQERPDEAGDG